MLVVIECNLQDGSPNVCGCYLVHDLAKAQNLAVQLAKGELQEEDHVDEASIRQEIEDNGDFFDPNFQWSVCVIKPSQQYLQ